jgi:hypothetical protein
MDENTEHPNLQKLMNKPVKAYWVDENESLLNILRRAPRQPKVIIETRVTFPDGTVVEDTRVETATLWDAYRQYHRLSLIRESADRVAARIALHEDRKRADDA